jgi:hypothetical protein
MKNGLACYSLLLLALILVPAPATFASTKLYVNGVVGNDSNDCLSQQAACKTIGHAISLAASGDSILVAAATYAESLNIGISLNIVGSGAATTIIEGGGFRGATISSATANVILSNLTIRNNHVSTQCETPGGGGVYNIGTLTIMNSIISGNTAFGANSRLINVGCGVDGGGIFNSGTLTIDDSAVSGNSVTVGGCYLVGTFSSATGGAIWSSGTLTINNSTITGNTAISHECTSHNHLSLLGGIFQYSGSATINESTISSNRPSGIQGSTLTVNNSTITGNTGSGIAGSTLTINNSTITGNTWGINDFRTLTVSNGTISGNSGFGIFINNGATATLQNSIVANNSTANCRGTMASHGYNLSSDGTCNFNARGDLNNHDPLLGKLQNNGGPTQTMALLPGSPAIDGGNPSGCTDAQGHLLKTDQRGMPRPDREDVVGCDKGAFESQTD